MPEKDWVYIDVEAIVAETDKAFLLMMDSDVDEKHWVPKSQMADPDNYSQGAEDLEDVAISRWIANQKGIAHK
jgi:hypothetical protein